MREVLLALLFTLLLIGALTWCAWGFFWLAIVWSLLVIFTFGGAVQIARRLLA